MATTQLLEIKPQELKFPFECRKPSSCSILLSNNSDQCLAFKIKTTSPKKYSVRPNVGIIKPNSTCDFTVTMQAQQVAPPNMQCKDKFLIQSTTVPSGTSDKNITSDMFAKDSGNYVEEKKIRVVLVRPLQSPVLLPINGVFNQEMQLEASSNKESRAHCGVENIPPTQMFIEGSEAVKDTAFMVLTKDVDLGHPHQHVNELQTLKDTQKVDLFGELRDLKSNMALMESKLIEAELTIEKLNNERKLTSIEKERLSNDLEVLKKSGARKVQQGFPFFFVCMVALISLTAGYLARS